MISTLITKTITMMIVIVRIPDVIIIRVILMMMTIVMITAIVFT